MRRVGKECAQKIIDAMNESRSIDDVLIEKVDRASFQQLVKRATYIATGLVGIASCSVSGGIAPTILFITFSLLFLMTDATCINIAFSKALWNVLYQNRKKMEELAPN